MRVCKRANQLIPALNPVHMVAVLGVRLAFLGEAQYLRLLFFRLTLPWRFGGSLGPFLTVFPDLPLKFCNPRFQTGIRNRHFPLPESFTFSLIPLGFQFRKQLIPGNRMLLGCFRRIRRIFLA